MMENSYPSGPYDRTATSNPEPCPTLEAKGNLSQIKLQNDATKSIRAPRPQNGPLNRPDAGFPFDKYPPPPPTGPRLAA